MVRRIPMIFAQQCSILPWVHLFEHAPFIRDFVTGADTLNSSTLEYTIQRTPDLYMLAYQRTWLCG